MSDWSFPAANDDYEGKGLNDSGIETFNDDCLKGLAREICQNSLDARRTDVPPNEPVVVEFKRFFLPSSQFPGKITFDDALVRSLTFWQNRKDEKTEAFFSTAIDVMSKEKVPWLRISDFRTIGLLGVSQGRDHSTTTPWGSLVMSSGVSNKPAGSGGSFGIGKFASFSCSKLRTCFYSTLTEVGEKGFQGVARLVSFENATGGITLGNGYFRDEGKPLNDAPVLDASFARGEMSGTDIFVPAFCGDDSWFEDVTASVLDGFLYAIFRNTLEVRLVDEQGYNCVLNRKWLDDQYNKGALADRATIRYNYEVLKNDNEDQIFRKEIGTDGKLELRLMLAPGLDRRIAMIRETGMKIYGKSGFSSSISFSGVLVVQGEELNKRIKKFENPQHTKWEPKRNPSDRRLLDEINHFCRESLEKLVQRNHSEELDAGLGDVLPAVGASDKKEERETLTAKIAKFDEPKRKKKRRPVVKTDSSEDGDTDSFDDGFDNDNGSGGGPGEEDGSASGNKGHSGSGEGEGNGQSSDGDKKCPSIKHVKAGSSRFACTNEASGEYRMFLVPATAEANGIIAVNAVAELNTYPASIVSARTIDGQNLRIEGNQIHGLVFGAGKMIQVILTLGYSEYVSLEVDWYGAN